MWMWRLAAFGWVASAAWHAALRLRYLTWWWVAGLLLIGLAVVWLPAVLRMASPQPLTAGWIPWSVVAACLAYAFVNMWWTAGDAERRPAIALSGHLVAFYALAATVLWPSAPVAGGAPRIR